MEQDVMNQIYNVDKDAFSSGQIGSKIWLCEELEKLFSSIDNLWIYGGWYGLTAFLLRSRGNIDIAKIRSFDLDPSCQPVADMINENWVYRNWMFKAETADCNKLSIKPGEPDLIINTSTEHFSSFDWWENIPNGTVVALQGNNMPHTDHYISSKSLDEFVETYPLSDLLYKGQMDFDYPEWSFSRYMVIGQK